MIKLGNSRNSTEMTKNEPKSSEFPLRNIQKYAEMCWNLQESADFAQKSTADRGDGRRAEPGGHGLHLAKHRKSIGFPCLFEGAASRGSGRPRPCPRGRRRPARMSQNVQKSREICRNLQNSAEMWKKLQEIAPNRHENEQNPPKSWNFMKIHWKFIENLSPHRALISVTQGI